MRGQLNRVYWFTHYNLDSPSVRYRAKYPLEYFRQKHGINYYLVIPGYSPARILKFLRAYFSALFFPGINSLIIIQKVRSNFIYAKLLKFLVRIRKKYTVYDLDDADYLRYNPKTIEYFIANCGVVSAGSREIVRHARKTNPRVVHVTTPAVDLGISKKNKNDLFTVGWIGYFGGFHRKSLVQVVFPALKELTFDYKLVMVGAASDEEQSFIENYFEGKKNIQIEIPRNINWNDEAGLQKRIVTFDIGIATLIDTEIQRAKSGIKAKQYLNNGVPVLSMNLPENNTVIVDGKNGFFCSDTKDFIDRITWFYEMDEKEYNDFSLQARNSIRHFNHEKYYSDILRLKKLQETA